MHGALDVLGTGSRDVVVRLKAGGPASITTLARRLGVSAEAVRKSVRDLEARGWVERVPAPDGGPRRVRRGRPPARYALSAAGEEVFPRAYADLAVALVDAVGSVLGAGALRRVLAGITDARVGALESLVRGQPLERRLAVARAVYRRGDAHLRVRRRGAAWEIEERDCPFLAVALARPALCSTTVSTLSRLLGVDVVRRETFQGGARRCVFVVDPAAPRRPDAPGFDFEPDAARARQAAGAP